MIKPVASLIKVLKGEILDPPSIWLMRQAGRYLPEYRELRSRAGGFLDLCQNPKLASEVTLQPVRRFNLDAAIIFSDILIVPYALGVKLWFVENEGPRLEAVCDEQSFAAMGERLDESKALPVYEALGRTKAKLPETVALIGFCGAPWTVATYLVAGRGSDDQSAAKQLMTRDEPLFQKIIERLVDATAEHLIGQLCAGADVVQIFDTWAGALDEEDFERWCVEPCSEIVARVRKAVPGAPVIVFPKGARLSGIEHLVRACKADAVSFDADMERKEAAAALGPLCALQGNLDPRTLLAGGDVLDQEVDKILEDFRGRRHIFNLGHGILKETPIAHVERMVERVRRAA
jgi:uroporphyrinogen decarboxylase